MSLYISWSSLRTHEECKQRGFLNRSHKRAPLANQRVFFPGTVTDRVVRDWLLMEKPELGLMPEMVESVVDREKNEIAEKGGVMTWKDHGDRDQVLKDCIEAVTKIEPGLVQHVLPYEYRPDFRFKAPLKVPHPNGGHEEVVLNGAMDIIVRNPETMKWAVWDVKHTRDNYYWKKTQGQLGFYDLTVQIMFNAQTEVVGLLQPLCDKPVLPVPLDVDTRSVMMSRIVRMAQEVWRGDKTPRADSSICGFCDVKHACTKFQAVNRGGKHYVNFGKS